MLPTKVIFQIDLSKDLDLYNWLKDLMQNPIYEDESEEESEFRAELFNTLNSINPQRTSAVRQALAKEKEDNSWQDEDIPF